MYARSTAQRVAVAIVAAALSITGLGACGSSGSTAKSKTTDKSATSIAGNAESGTSGAGKSDVSTACLGWLAMDERAGQGPESSEDGPPTQAQIAAFANDLKPLIANVVSAAPGEIAKPARRIKALVDDAATGKNQQKLEPGNPALAAPLAKIEKWVHGECGFNTLDVMGEDYAFKGIDSSVKSGPSSIKFMNMSDKEMHEIVLMRINPGVALTAKDLATAMKADTNGAEQKYGDKVTFLTQAQAEPGKATYLTANLNVGEYVAVCFIPQGGKDDGTPHSQLGMVTPFTVE